MNTYGPHVSASLRRVAEYQQAYISHAPGYGPDAHNVGVYGISDVFVIKNDYDLNKALNTLHKRLHERD